jgi:hypothetical protein
VQLGNNQRQTGCCGGTRIDEDGNETCNTKYTTYNCCPPGSESRCTTTNGSIYTKSVCPLPGWSYNLCDKAQYPWQENDVLVRTYSGEPRCGWYDPGDGNAREPVYTLYQECRKRITTCSCEQVSGTVSGRVYYDEGNTCSTATPWSTGGLSTRLRGTGYTSSVGAG